MPEYQSQLTKCSLIAEEREKKDRCTAAATDDEYRVEAMLVESIDLVTVSLQVP